MRQRLAEMKRRAGRQPGAECLAPAMVRALAIAAMVVCGVSVRAQTNGAAPVAQQRWLMVEPNASVTQTVTDNFLLTAQSPSGDAVTQLTAGVALRAEGARVRGHLEYALSSLVYARHGDRDTHQNALSSAFSADLAEGRAKLDVSATISQAAVSAFGVQPAAGSLPNANTTELRTLRVAPSVYGPLGPGLRYTATLGYTLSATGSGASRAGNSNATDLSLHIAPTVRNRLSWALDATHQASAYEAGRRTDDDRLIASLVQQVVDLDLQLSANAGGEYSNQSTLQRTFYTNWGAGAVWAPSPRTNLSAELEHRYFGRSHSLTLEHRTALTVWRLSDSRSLSDSASSALGGGMGAVYDSLFAQLALLQPDPVKRAALVQALMSSPGFLQSSATIQDMQEISVAWRGSRSGATVRASRGTSRRADGGVIDAAAQAQEVRQRSVSLDLSHQLTPKNSIGLVLTNQNSGGGVGVSSRQRMLTLHYAAQPTLRSNLDIGLRRALYASQPQPFDETAIFATLGLRF